MGHFIIYVLVNAIAFWLVSRLMPGWKIKSEGTAIVVALVYSVLAVALTMFALPFLLLLLPFLMIPLVGKLVGWAVGFCLTLLVVVLTDKLIEDFEIKDMATAVVGTFVLSIIQSVLRHLL
jgi:uncharacterized membrane protein YvlD (DUF360 family)